VNIVGRAGVSIAVTVLAAGAPAACGGGSSHDGIDRDAALASAVHVEAAGCGPRVRLGMGTTIADGLVVTAAHVVGGTDRIDVVDADAHRVRADVVMFDPDLDIAALRPRPATGRAAMLRAEPVRAGDVGVVVVPGADGADEFLPVTVLRTVTVRTTDIYLDTPVERPGFEIDAPIEPGDSGAMVHFADGADGVVWARSTTRAGRAWAVTVPEELIDASTRRQLVDTVDTGPCP
jgi:S1-C subfamily serine protease